MGGWHYTSTKQFLKDWLPKLILLKIREVRDNPPQIASAASAEEKELIDDLFAELNETDLAQFATESGL